MAEKIPDDNSGDGVDKITAVEGGGDVENEESNKNGSSSRSTCRGKVCQVCGDKALGYNFNAVTCESCKAFFRRNALNKKEFTCPFNQNCDITVVTRRFCQRCRLGKCFSIGMKKEYIMSEADKLAKRRKIEANRAKRQHISGGLDTTANSANSSDVESPTSIGVKRIKCEEPQSEDNTSPWSMVEDSSANMVATPLHVTDYHRPCSSTGYDSCSPSTADPMYSATSSMYTNVPLTPPTPIPAPSLQTGPVEMMDMACQVDSVTNMVSELASNEIVNRIVGVPEKSSQAIAQLMPTQQDALKVLSVVISSPADALRLIDHFIAQPGDALTIISKLMNSALDALSVFIQFMSSPTDALQIINKIMNSPEEVLQFIQQLMKYPQDALDIMTKFMNEPAEALKMINRMINNDETMAPEGIVSATGNDSQQDLLRRSVEGNLIKSIINTNTIEVGPQIEGGPPPPLPNNFNPFNSYSHLSYPSTSTGMCSEQLSASVSGFPLPICHIKVPISDCEPPPAAPQMNGQLNDVTDTSNTPTTDGHSASEDRTRDILEEVENKSFQPHTIESIICEAISVEYACLSTNTKSRELNDAERAKLNELIVANKALYAPVDEDWANLIGDNARFKVSKDRQ